MAKHVEDDLHALHVRIVHRLESLFRRLDAHAVVAQLAGRHEIVEHAEHFRPVVHVVRRAVELQQVDRLGVEILQAAIDERGEVLAVVAFGRVRVQPPPGFGGDANLLASGVAGVSATSRSLRPSPYTSAVSMKLTPRSIARSSAASESLVVDISPRSADGPGAEADRRHLPTGAAEFAVLHG